MSVTDTVLERIISAGERNRICSRSDYSDSEGFLCCGVCGQRKEAMISFGNGRERKVPVICACYEEKLRREKENEWNKKVCIRKEKCFSHAEMLHNTFENDNGVQPKMKIGREYVRHWKEAAKENAGLLLLGGVGTGKSYCACAIANALCEKDISVRFVNLAEVLNELQSCPDRNEVVRNLTTCALLIIDDFGIQRNTEYANEQVFNLLDSRDRSGKPLIVTTNMTYRELTEPADTRQERIFSRLRKMCTPVLFEGEDLREREGIRKKNIISSFFPAS